jgi:hypothetical protein
MVSTCAQQQTCRAYYGRYTIIHKPNLWELYGDHMFWLQRKRAVPGLRIWLQVVMHRLSRRRLIVSEPWREQIDETRVVPASR